MEQKAKLKTKKLIDFTLKKNFKIFSYQVHIFFNTLQKSFHIKRLTTYTGLSLMRYRKKVDLSELYSF
jgi:hypothetical protein